MQVKVAFNAHRGIKYIFDQLPGRKCLLDVSSKFPKDIITSYKDILSSHDSVMFYNDDVWRYGDDPVLLDFFADYPGTQFYIQHLGYSTRWIANNAREFCIPFLITADSIPKVPLKNNADWGFASLNNRPSYARLLLGYYLWSSDLLDGMVYTQNNYSLESDQPLIQGYTRYLLDQLPNINEYFDSLPRRWKNEHLFKPQRNVTQNDQFNTFRFYDHDAYDNAYCFITTETETEWWGHDRTYPTPIATEKTFKPFYSAQVGMWLVAQGQLSWLKQHGLIVFEDLVGQDYDQKNTQEKILTIVEVVNKGREFIEDYYHNHREEIKHNQDWMLTGKFESSIIETVTKFLF